MVEVSRPEYDGWLGWIRKEWDEATSTPQKEKETKEVIAVCMVAVLVIVGIILLMVGATSARAESSRAVAPATQKSIRPTPTEQLSESNSTPTPVQSAATPEPKNNMVIASAPEPVKTLPAWATKECVLRIAGTVQGEAGGLNSETWYAVAQQAAYDANECNFKTSWVGGLSGTANEIHTYDFEKTWYGRTSKNDNRALDAGMILSVLESEVRPEILKVVTQSLVDFGGDAAKYPNCAYTDNFKGMLLRVSQGVSVDYIFTGNSPRITEGGAEFIMGCPQGK